MARAEGVGDGDVVERVWAGKKKKKKKKKCRRSILLRSGR